MFPPNNTHPPMTAAAPQGGPTAAAPQGGAPMPQGAPQGGFHGELLMRLKALSPQDRDALRRGVSPEAAVVLIKVFPELKQMIAAQMGGGAPQGGNVTGGPAAGAEMAGMEAQARPPMPPRPATKLGQF